MMSCHNKPKKHPKIIWAKKSVFKFTINLPSSYSIYYLQDSSTAKISNGSVKIDFINGYFSTNDILNSPNIVDKSSITSSKKLIFDSTASHQTSLAMFLWDTIHVIHLFKDAKYKGCNLASDNLTDKQRDTVLKIFRSLTPILK